MVRAGKYSIYNIFLKFLFSGSTSRERLYPPRTKRQLVPPGLPPFAQEEEMVLTAHPVATVATVMTTARRREVPLESSGHSLLALVVVVVPRGSKRWVRCFISFCDQKTVV